MITKEKIEAILEANEECLEGGCSSVSNYDKVSDEIMKEVKKDSTIHNVRILAMKKEVELLNEIIASDVKRSFENPSEWAADLDRMKGKIELLDLLLMGES